MSTRRARRGRASPKTATARAVDCIRRLVNALGESARAVEQRTGLTNAQLFLLRQLALEHELTINQLAERALTQQSTVSLLVRRLETSGYVLRTRSRDDGRRVCVALTARGRTIIARAPKPPLTRMIEAIDHIAPGEVESLIRGLGALLKEMHVPQVKAPLFERGRRSAAR